MKKGIRYGYLGLLLLFLYLPLVLLVVYSFNKGGAAGNFTGFTLRWYVELFTNPKNHSVLQALWVTVACAGVAAVISTIFGTIAAVGIYGFTRGWRNGILNITYLPIINPDIVTGISLFMMLAWIHVPFGFVTLVLAHVGFDVPYVIFAVFPKLSQMDPHLYEAALDLGSKPTRAIVKVVMPQLWPGIITGGLLAFTLSMDDFVISYFTGGKVQNLSVLVYSMTKRGISTELNAISALLFVVVLGLLLAVNRRSDTMLQF